MTIDELANEIRRVDGNNSLGAGALAEALMPFLSAAPPPDGEEVERVATALWRHEAERAAPESTIRARTLEGFRQSGEENRALWLGRARAAIASMRPTLSEEDRAGVEEVMGRANTFSGRFWEVGPQTRVAMIEQIVGDRAFLLSLVDKLAGQP